MSRVATPAEKIMAVAAIHTQLMEEMPRIAGLMGEPNVQVALIDAAVRIAMSTDTRDMGILSPSDPGPPEPTPDHHPYQDMGERNLCDICDKWRGAPEHAG